MRALGRGAIIHCTSLGEGLHWIVVNRRSNAEFSKGMKRRKEGDQTSRDAQDGEAGWFPQNGAQQNPTNFGAGSDLNWQHISQWAFCTNIRPFSLVAEVADVFQGKDLGWGVSMIRGLERLTWSV